VLVNICLRDHPGVTCATASAGWTAWPCSAFCDPERDWRCRPGYTLQMVVTWGDNPRLVSGNCSVYIERGGNIIASKPAGLKTSSLDRHKYRHTLGGGSMLTG